jgi:ketosteroid isomerase-like protein
VSINIKIIQDFQNLISNEDQSNAYRLIADDALWHSDEIDAPWSGVHKGIEEIKKHFSAISGTTKNFKRFDQNFIEDKGLVIEIGSLSCLLNKTGQPFSTDYVCLWQVLDGKIMSYRIFEDSLKLYKAYYHD